MSVRHVHEAVANLQSAAVESRNGNKAAAGSERSLLQDLALRDVKRIIMESSTKLRDQMVVRPGAAGDRARFGDMSVSGGIVNVYNAVRAAQALQP